METNYEQEKKHFEDWWNKITDKSYKWTTIERMDAHDAWMKHEMFLRKLKNKELWKLKS